MSEDRKDELNVDMKEEGKVPERGKVTKDNPMGYPPVKPHLRKDGQEVVAWTMNPTSDFVNPYGLTLRRKKRKKTPEYDKPREGCAILQPKVNEPFEAIPRRITRKELVKKIQENFKATNVEDILRI